MSVMSGSRRVLPGVVMLAMAGLTGVANADSITFTDQRGKLIELEAPAERVIVLPKPIPSMLIAVDGGIDRLVGLHPAAQAVLMEGLPGKLYPGIADIDTSIVGEGFIPNVEAMLVAEPDVVIQWASRPEDRIDPMERVGITVVGFGYGSYEIEAEQIEIMGKILGREDRAAALLEWHKAVRENIDQVVADIPEEERTTMLFFDRFDSDELAVFGRNEFFFQVPAMRNLAFEAGLDQTTVTIDAEQLLKWDPDVILLNYYDPEADPQKVYDDPRFAGLEAVRNRRVYKTPKLDPGSHEAPLVWSWLATLAYPDAFDMDHRAEIAKQLEAMYGTAPDDGDLDSILQLSDNGDSHRYGEHFGR